MSFQPCIHVRNSSQVAYWKKTECLELFPLEDGILPVQAGQYAVWVLQDGGPALDVMGEEEFGNRFVTAENLPPMLEGRLDEVPTYEKWVKSTYISEVEK